MDSLALPPPPPSPPLPTTQPRRIDLFVMATGIWLTLWQFPMSPPYSFLSVPSLTGPIEH